MMPSTQERNQGGEENKKGKYWKLSLQKFCILLKVLVNGLGLQAPKVLLGNHNEENKHWYL